MIDYNIIASGSKGNAVILNKSVLIDCGVGFKTLAPHIDDLKLVLLTHRHSDHFKKSTVQRLADLRPTLRFGCGEWLAKPLVECGVNPINIDIAESDKMYRYALFDIIQVPLVHDVLNCGWKIHFPEGKVIYATDTNNLNCIEAKNYDLYLIEANYSEEEIENRIKEKEEKGEYAYEREVLKNHLEKSKCDDFIYKNIGSSGVYVYMHEHKNNKNESVIKDE